MEVYRSGRQAFSTKLWKTWLRYRGSVIVPKYQFVVDEGALTLDDVLNLSAKTASQVLSTSWMISADRGNIRLVENWGSVECVGGEDVAQSLATCQILDRDQSMRLLTLLDRCFAWDRPADEDFDPAVVVDGNQYDGEGSSLGSGPGDAEELDCSHYHTPSLCGRHPTKSKHRLKLVRLMFISVCPLGIIPDSFVRCTSGKMSRNRGSLNGARLAFPRLVFAAGLSFRNFQGTYRTLRPQVVHHLGRINDEFAEAYAEERGMSNEISGRLGIDVSIEGNTRGSQRLMRQRDVEFCGRVYRCEWHSKIEPHRNRIHFHVIDGTSEKKILIGIFNEHLIT